MKIRTVKSKVTEFKQDGDLNGSFIGTNQFFYQLTPFHPEHGCIFNVFCETVTKGSKSGELRFKAMVSYAFDGEKTKPTMDGLLKLSDMGVDDLNKLLEKEIMEKTDIYPFKIYPSNREHTISTLQQNLLVAYPEN